MLTKSFKTPSEKHNVRDKGFSAQERMKFCHQYQQDHEDSVSDVQNMVYDVYTQTIPTMTIQIKDELNSIKDTEDRYAKI